MRFAWPDDYYETVEELLAVEAPPLASKATWGEPSFNYERNCYQINGKVGRVRIIISYEVEGEYRVFVWGISGLPPISPISTLTKAKEIAVKQLAVFVHDLLTRQTAEDPEDGEEEPSLKPVLKRTKPKLNRKR